MAAARIAPARFLRTPSITTRPVTVAVPFHAPTNAPLQADGASGLLHDTSVLTY